MQSAAINVPRFDYDPTTLLPRGILVEISITNRVRNNTMAGVAAGTPGTLPTNWITFTGVTGLTREIVGTGTSPGRLTRRLNGREEEADECADDGDDHEQFDQREAGLVWSFRPRHSHGRLLGERGSDWAIRE